MEMNTATVLPERPPLPEVAPDAGTIEVAAGGQPVLARIADLARAGPPRVPIDTYDGLDPPEPDTERTR